MLNVKAKVACNDLFLSGMKHFLIFLCLSSLQSHLFGHSWEFCLKDKYDIFLIHVQLYILDVYDFSFYDGITFVVHQELRMNFDLIL